MWHQKHGDTPVQRSFDPHPTSTPDIPQGLRGADALSQAQGHSKYSGNSSVDPETGVEPSPSPSALGPTSYRFTSAAATFDKTMSASTPTKSPDVLPRMGPFRSDLLHQHTSEISPSQQDIFYHNIPPSFTNRSSPSGSSSGSTVSEATIPHSTQVQLTKLNRVRNQPEPSDPEQSSIVLISIPRSHQHLFAKVLSSPPDPTLKIKKKSVRFDNSLVESGSSSSPSKSLRRDRECPVAFSKIKFSSISSSPPLKSGGSSRALYPTSSTAAIANIISNGSHNSSISKVHGPIVPDNRDPEEKMAELMELKQMKIRQGDFLHLKDQIFQISQDLEDKEGILGEIRGERKTLQSELHRHIAMVKQIQKDFEFAQQAEIQLIKERDQLSQHLTQLKHHDFKTLKEEVDQLRRKKGLPPLASLEQEEAEFMGRYLEQRRGQWREDGTKDSVSLSNDHHHSSSSYGSNGSHNEAGPSSSSRTTIAAAGQSSSKSSRPSASSSSLASAMSSTPRERDNSGRSEKTRALIPGHTRSSSRLGDSKHELSSRAGTGGRSSSSSSSKSIRQSHSRSQSPTPIIASSATSRAERSKKRSRY